MACQAEEDTYSSIVSLTRQARPSGVGWGSCTTLFHVWPLHGLTSLEEPVRGAAFPHPQLADAPSSTTDLSRTCQSREAVHLPPQLAFHFWTDLTEPECNSCSPVFHSWPPQSWTGRPSLPLLTSQDRTFPGVPCQEKYTPLFHSWLVQIQTGSQEQSQGSYTTLFYSWPPQSWKGPMEPN